MSESPGSELLVYRQGGEGKHVLFNTCSNCDNFQGIKWWNNKKYILSEDLHKRKNPWRSWKLHVDDSSFIFCSCALFVFLFLWEMHNAMYWKIKRTSPPDILLLTHYIMRSHFFFALMHGCSHAPPECRGLHVCATCCVCCGDGASWRWMRSAVWNSADPLKWLLVATRERERGRWPAWGTCGQMSHPHPRQNTHTIYV